MKLTDWLASHHITQAQFGVRIGRDQAYVSKICRFDLWPSKSVMIAIRDATNGAVMPDDFLSGPI